MRWATGIGVTSVLGLALLLAGCGGSMSHSIQTPYRGSLRGVVINPPQGSRDVSTRVKPTVSWRAPDEPPAIFTLSLKAQRQGGDFDPVPTRLEQVSETEWRLRPTYPLSTGTLYAVVVASGIERIESWFITEEFRIFSRSPESSEPEPPAAALSEPADQHTIIYRRR
ncbi:MAG: hypothetical protein SNJ72_02665 [Fimbriimonadales bacterium]